MKNASPHGRTGVDVAENGNDLSIKSIIKYGDRILGRVRENLPDLAEVGSYEEIGKTNEGT
jgi:hypothetical protein